MADTLEVVVPDGIGPGEPFSVETGEGVVFEVIVPDDYVPGTVLAVTVPEEGPPPVEVVVPEGILPGDEFLVDTGEQQFYVVCPDEIEPGMAILVNVPPPPDAENESQQQQLIPTATHSNAKPILDTTKGCNLNLCLAGGFTISLALETQPKYPINSKQEVMRNDGSWSVCTIREYDWRGVTYTVEVNKGLKYFVEEEDIQPIGGH